MRSAILIYNPTAGRHGAEALVGQLRVDLARSGYDVEPRPTTAPGDAVRLAREAADQVEVAFGLGGDGTLREVATGLLGSRTALGVLPSGTANVLTWELNLPRDPRAAARAHATSEIRRIDVGMAGEEPFLMMASCGLDAQIMANPPAVWKRRIGVTAIGVAGLAHWWRYGYPEMRLRFEGREEPVGFFSLSNIAYFGGRFRLAPDARSDDGCLDLVLFRGRDRWRTLSFLGDVATGRHAKRSDVEIHSVEEIELVGPCVDGLQIDGDVLPVELPLRLSVAHRALRVLTPGGRLGREA